MRSRSGAAPGSASGLHLALTLVQLALAVAAVEDRVDAQVVRQPEQHAVLRRDQHEDGLVLWFAD